MVTHDFSKYSNEELAINLDRMESKKDIGPETLIIGLLDHDQKLAELRLEIQGRLLRSSLSNAVLLNQKVADLYDLMPMGYISIHDDLTIIEINLVLARYIGVPREELLGKNFSDYVVDANSLSSICSQKDSKIDTIISDINIKGQDGTTLSAVLLGVKKGNENRCLSGLIFPTTD